MVYHLPRLAVIITDMCVNTRPTFVPGVLLDEIRLMVTLLPCVMSWCIYGWRGTITSGILCANQLKCISNLGKSGCLDCLEESYK